MILQCTLNLPLNANTNDSVHLKWHRRKLDNITTRFKEELEYDSDPASESDSLGGLTLIICSQDIENFTLSENESYWCQKEASHPSLCRYVVFNSTVELHSINCTGADMALAGGGDLCAVSISASDTADNENQSCANLMIQLNFPRIFTPEAPPLTPASTFLVPMPTGSPHATPPQQEASELGYGIIGFVVFICSMLSAVLTLLVVVFLSRRSTRKRKSNGKGKSSTQELKTTCSNCMLCKAITSVN